MDELLTRMQTRGWRLTAQRRVVAEVLAGDDVHMTADEVHRAAVGRLPEISRATVYNTLNELVGLGEVREVRLDGRACLYDPNADALHHHLVCEGCGAVVDVQLAAPPLPRAESHGYEVERVEITYRGRCPRCQAL